jgi:hypothetical protein
MSDDDEDDAEKTQIFLPGANNPLPKLKPAAPPKAPVAAEPATTKVAAAAVDFDITSGAGLGDDAIATVAAATVAGVAAAEQKAPSIEMTPASEPSAAFRIIVIVLIVAAIGYFVLR